MRQLVFPHCPRAEAELRKISDCGRLFAYPAKPVSQDCKVTILDSGAFGFFEAGKRPGNEYFKKLSDHYERYADEKTICVAPDVVCDPMETMMRFDRWHRMGLYQGISPVIQPDNAHSINIELYKYQINFYTTRFGIKTLLFSNWVSADIAIGLGIQQIITFARTRGVEYIHMLGAGWNIDDVRMWNTIDGITSCDTIAYYTSGCKERFGSEDPAENARRIICAIRGQST